MKQPIITAPKLDSEFAASASEILYSVSRQLVWSVVGVYALLLLATAIWPQQLGAGIWLLLPLIAFVCGGALLLIPQHFVVAQFLFLSGLTAVIVLATYLFQEPAIALAYVFVPLLATITISWRLGAVMEVLAVVLAWWLDHGLIQGGVEPIYAPLIIIGGAIGGLIGWASTQPLFAGIRWFFFSYQDAQVNLSELREQQLLLKQTEEDLLLANRELARMTERLRALNVVADESRRVKEEFVANVSHELRTPLNMIIGFSEMIVRAPQVYGDHLPSALLSDINTIHLNSRHLLKLVDDVLDLSQVDCGRMALKKQLCSLKEIADAAALAVQPLYRSKELYLQVDMPDDLPPVMCDPTRIRQVILNLLSNAGRFTEQGRVRVGASVEKGQVIVGVTDTGPGIAEQDQAKLFEPFRQLDGSTQRGQGGFGLGLSISKKFVELHEGKMWLDSSVGHGTTFYFSLPAGAAPGEDSTLRGTWRRVHPYSTYDYHQRTQPSKAPAPHVNPRFVLLDERNILLRLFERYLTDVELVAVSDEQEAIRELDRLPAQALIVNSAALDDGAPILKRPAHLPFDTPVLTCRVASDEDAAERLHVARYLVKPVAFETLIAALDSLGEDVRNVLLVDDNPEELRLLARMLMSTGRNYRILRARNGQRALSLLRQHHPDAVFLDLLMPGMNGYRVLEEKERDPAIRDIPVAILSAQGPLSAPIASSHLTVTCGEGLSVSQLLTCVRALSDALIPAGRRTDPAPPGNHRA
jgi:signal transduction histidine kinase/CheY-like chemotaxis protein